MAEVKKLRLKAVKAGSGSKIAATHLPVAKVQVDTGVFHLDRPFDYLVPVEWESQAQPGFAVLVPFGGRELPGIITDRIETSESAELKFISSITSLVPIINPELFPFYKSVADRCAVPFYEILQLAIPPRAPKVEVLFQNAQLPVSIGNHAKLTHKLNLIPPGKLPATALLDLVKESVASPQILVIVPDEKDVESFLLLARVADIDEPLVLTSALPRSERYRNHLKALFQSPRIIVGTRSAIFTPLSPGSSIILYSDGEESLYNKHYPKWNTRDLMLLRAEICNIHFLSYTPTLETARLVEELWLTVTPAAKSISGLHFQDGRESYQTLIRKGLSTGSVLVTTAKSGYVDAFACQKCRNRAICDCGGRLFLNNRNIPTCWLCSKTVIDWSCSYCNSREIRAFGKGSERVALEFAKAFPGVSIRTSSSKRRIDSLPEGIHLVISTNGCEPIGEYSSVILLDGEQLFNRVGMHADEQARRSWFTALAMKSDLGTAFISLPIDHPAAQSLLKWSVYPQVGLELTEHRAAQLPPYFRIATITGASQEIESIQSSLSGHPLFTAASLLKIEDGKSKLILRSPIESSQACSQFFYDLRRVRSLSGLGSQSPIDIELDPYEI